MSPDERVAVLELMQSELEKTVSQQQAEIARLTKSAFEVKVYVVAAAAAFVIATGLQFINLPTYLANTAAQAVDEQLRSEAPKQVELALGHKIGAANAHMEELLKAATTRVVNYDLEATKRLAALRQSTQLTAP